MRLYASYAAGVGGGALLLGGALHLAGLHFLCFFGDTLGGLLLVLLSLEQPQVQVGLARVKRHLYSGENAR